jgi:hypothetical protein
MNGTSPLSSLAAYSRFVAELLDRPTIKRSTLAVWSVGPRTGVAEGEEASTLTEDKGQMMDDGRLTMAELRSA